MSRVQLFDQTTKDTRSIAPITLFPYEEEPPPEDPDEPTTGQGEIAVLDIGALPTGFSLPNLTPRWGTQANDWEVVSDGTALSGRVIRAYRRTASARRLLTWNRYETMTDKKRTEVVILWRSSTPSSARVGVRLSGSTAATAYGYLGGATNDAKVGVTRYLNGAATTTNLDKALTPNTWYVTVVEDTGSEIRSKTFPFGTAEPSGWDNVQSDITMTVGWVGLFVFEPVGATDFAYFSVATGVKVAPRPSLPTGQNAKPFVNAGPAQSVVSGQTVALDGTVSDPDGIVTTTLWTQVSGTPVTLANASSVDTTFTAPATQGDLVFQLKAIDDDQAESTATVTIKVVDEVIIAPTSSRGPNGTHWPPATPTPWAPATYTVTTLEAAFVKLSDCSGGECIVVTGTSSAGTSSTEYNLSGGSMNWTQNVLIRGANLFQPITGYYNIRAHHVTVSGFTVSGGKLGLVGTDRSFIARTVWDSNRQWSLSSNRNGGLYECVIPKYTTGGGDDYLRIGGSSGTGWVGSQGLKIVGCWFKSKMVPPEPSGGWTSATFPHCDTMQTYSPNAPAVNTEVRDCVIFTAGDKVFQGEDGHVKGMKWINVWMDSPSNSREPIPAGWDMGPYGQSISGVGDDFYFEKCTILGMVNHKNGGTSVTSNSGTFKDCEIKGGNADEQNNPTLINHVSTGTINWDNRPPPPLPTLTSIWAKP